MGEGLGVSCRVGAVGERGKELPSHSLASGLGVSVPAGTYNLFCTGPWSKNVGTVLLRAVACGDVIKLQIQVDEKGKIMNARFKIWM